MVCNLKTTRCVEAVALCLLLSTAASLAQKQTSKDPIFDEKCGGVPDDAEVKIYAWPATGPPRGKGTEVDQCSVFEQFGKIIEGEAASRGRRRSNRLQNEESDCSHPDLAFALISDTVPGPQSQLCDITDAYINLFSEDNIQKSLILCLMPPLYCKITTPGNRRLLVDPSERERGDNTVLSLAFLREDARGPRNVSRKKKSSSKSFAITACKGGCCITSAVTGTMLDRLSSAILQTSCPNPVKPPTGPKPTTSSGSRSSSSSSSSSRNGGGGGNLPQRSMDAIP